MAAARRPALVFLFLTVFVDMLGYGMVVPSLPFLVREHSQSAVMVGFLASVYAGMQFLGSPILGSLSDRIGRRPVLITCLLGTSAAYLLLGSAGSLWMIALAVALAGTAAGTIATAQAYIADSTAAKNRAKGLGLIGAAFGLGLISGPALGGLLSLYSLHAPVLAASAIALSNAIFGYTALPESLKPEFRKKIPLANLNPISRLIETLSTPKIKSLLATVFLLNIAFAGLLSNFPLFSNVRFGWDTAANSIFFSFVGLCAAVTQGVLLGALQPRFGEEKLLLVGLAIMSTGLYLIAAVPNGWILYPVVGLLAAGAGLAIPSLTSLISRRSPQNEQGRTMGGLQALLSLTLIIGPISAGFVFDRIAATAPYVAGGLLTTLALIFACLSLKLYFIARIQRR